MFVITNKSHANIVTAHFSDLFSVYRKCNKSEKSFIFERPKSSDLTSTIYHVLENSISWLNMVMWSSSYKHYKEWGEKEPLWKDEVKEFPIMKYFHKAPRNDLMQTPHLVVPWE